MKQLTAFTTAAGVGYARTQIPPCPAPHPPLDMKAKLLLLALTSGLSTPSYGYDWPQWMGPNRDGLTEETGLQQDWPEGGPERLWLSKACGLGYSGPAVVDGELFVMGLRDGEEELMALDAATGEERWSLQLDGVYENGWGDGPRGTPTVDGDRVYVLGAKGTLACVRREDGGLIWSVDLVEDFGGKIPTWGYSESPLIDGDRVVITPGNEQGAIVALDKQTGEPLWQTAELTTVAHYSSVVEATIHGRSQYVQLLEDQLVGVAPDSGEVLWSVEWPGRVAVIPTPLVKDNRVFVTTGYGVGCMLVEIDHDNQASVVYQNKTLKNHHGGALLLGDHVFGHSDGTGWMCLDFATGKRVWRERAELGKGAIAYADGRFVCLGEDDGQVVLIEASAGGWEEHGRFTLDPQTEQRKPKGKIWTHPVIANGRMYLRDQELLFCFDISTE